jgi:putative ABC transport system permease protein
MLKNYLKITLRNFFRYKTNSVINIAGLSIGMAVFIIIILFVKFQLSFDTFNKKMDRTYRVIWVSKSNPGNITYVETPELLGPALKQQFPQIESLVRIEKHYPLKALVSYSNKSFYETDFLHTDSSFFNLFSFKFIKGNAENALDNPNSLVITQSISKKFFGSQDPIGKILTVDNTNKYIVTGVIKDVPLNSHFHFNFIARKSEWTESYWFMFGSYTYIVLKDGQKPGDLEKQFSSFLDKNVFYPGTSTSVSKDVDLELQPLKSIHLYSNHADELEPNGSIIYVRIFLAIAFLILLMACINYTNMSTTKYLERISEIGVRKALGASNKSIGIQILTESTALAFISLIIAIVLVELLLSTLTNYTGIEIPSLIYQGNYSLVAFLILFTIVTGVLAGGYPAFFISRRSSSLLLRKSIGFLSIKYNMRKILIVFQFTIAILIIIVTSVFFSQLHFMENKNMGFDKENIIIIKDQANTLSKGYRVFKNTLLQNPYIESVTSGDVPGENGSLTYSFSHNGKPFDIRVIQADFDYIKTLKLQLIEGRIFNSLSDSSNVLINEACAKVLNTKNINRTDFGKSFKKRLGVIIGIIKDFNMKSLREEVTPVVLQVKPFEHSNVIIRIKQNSTKEALPAIKKTWNTFVKNRPIQYSFLNDDLNKLYANDQQLARIFIIFAIIAIFIAGIGLFGVSSLITEQRTKEIGIRKVLGASVQEICFMFTKEFSTWVIISNIIAWPIAYFFMNDWLQNFAYRINISVWVFILSGVCALLIAIITVGYQAIKAATADPVKSLRYE